MGPRGSGGAIKINYSAGEWLKAPAPSDRIMNEHDTVVPSSRRVVGLLWPGELSSSPGRGAQVWPYCVCGCIVVTGCELPRVEVVETR